MNRRAAFEKLLVERCDIYRPTVTVNEHHERIGEDALIASGVKCAAGTNTDTTLLFSGGVDNKTTRLFLFAFGTDLRERDLIEYQGRRFFVRAADTIFDKQTGQGHHIEATGDTVIGG